MKILFQINLCLISVFFLTLSHVELKAQSLQDIQNIRVDNLSDAQIESLIQRAQASGLSENQLVAMARERGMPASEVSKLRQRIEKLRMGASGTRTTGTGTRPGLSPAEQQGQAQGVDPYADLTDFQKKIFGYKLFYNKELNFNPTPNTPTPQNYLLGAGDELIIDVYGASQESYDLIITPEGKIFVPNVGPIQVGGATIEAARTRIKNSLSRIYAGLSGNNPNTFLEVRLGNIRSISVAMVGELNKPGNYLLPSYSTVFNALFAAGGPNEQGSFRHIQVYRSSKLVAEVDIYEFLTSGQSTSNISLKDNDVVIVQPIRSRVEIIGPVRREGLFETKPSESIETLLNYAGGFTNEAYRERVTITRYAANEMRVEDIDASNFAQYPLQDGDIIRIGKTLSRFENRVQIQGAVFRPGTFQLTDGLTVKQLIKKADGLREDAFPKRAILYRTKPDFSLEIIPLNIEDIIHERTQDFVLLKEDVLNVPSIYELEEEYFIKINGEVNRPGTYPYASNMTVSDLVIKAGGFNAAATSSKIEIARRVKDDISGKLAEIIVVDIDKDLKINGSNSDEILKPFDHVTVRRSPGFQRERFATIEGEVFYPGEYALSKANERISDLIKRAGGLNQFAYANGAVLLRRTEFFEAPNEDELRLAVLKELKSNLERDSIDYSEAEKILISRIDYKSKMLREKLSKEEEKKFEQFWSNSDSASVARRTALKEMKTSEYVGINLPLILKKPGSIHDIFLEEGDVLYIPRERQTVKIRGEVLYTNSVRFESNKRFGHYISSAGGFTLNAKRNRSYVIYANGSVKRTRNYLIVRNYPKIESGSEIVVPPAPDRRKITVTEFVGVSTSLLTLYLLLNSTILNR